MKKFRTCILLAGLVLSACVNLVPQESTSIPPQFVTSTLPPTVPAFVLPTGTAVTFTPDPSITSTPATETTVTPGSGSTQTASGTCQDSAAMIEDVTVPDNTVMTKGQTFTKTWRFLNNGKCNWSGYSIAFFGGDRMSSPDSVPIQDTPAGKAVDVSVNLTAPSTDGAYTGFYLLKNNKGETLPIGIEQSFWLKILIGNAVAAPVSTPVTSGGTVVVPTTSGVKASCTNYSTSSSYASQLAGLINDARTQAGLSTLNVNAALQAAAQGHSVDMACHNLLSHSGSDSSSPGERIAAAGYAASSSSEIIYGSGYPQTAFDWWMSDTTHRNEILNPYITDMGVGYAYNNQTAYGSYFTVDFASP
jgi:uncharacterized protein YkwD